MFRKSSSVALLMIGLLFIGCQNDSGPIQSVDSDRLCYPALSQAILPADAELQAAKLFVKVHAYGSEDEGMAVNVYIHRSLNNWTELGVTWNNFYDPNPPYDPYVFGSFTVSGTGWVWGDVTALVQGWLDGDYPNYGILLDEDEMCWAHLYSREYGSVGSHTDQAAPFLEVTYSSGGGTITDTIITNADAYIWDQNPTSNYGDKLFLKTGYDQLKEKQTLLWCEIAQETPEDGCTHAITFWRNFCGVEPRSDSVSQYLPIYLGNDGGSSSIFVNDCQTVYDILYMEWGDPGNGIIELYAHLLTAKLNFASGASDNAVADIVIDADDFLDDHDSDDWDSLSEADKAMVIDWAATLDLYNNGEIGPGPCPAC